MNEAELGVGGKTGRAARDVSEDAGRTKEVDHANE
jgi:hypothetical protein